MLKINLLPPYIHQRKQVKIAIGVVIALIAAEVGLLVAARSGPMAEKQQLTTVLAQKQQELTALQAVGTESTTVLAEEAGLAPKYDFLTGMLKYNRHYPELYRSTAAYTYSEAMMLDLAAQGNTLTFNAYVSNPVAVSRLMLGLSRSPDFDGLPQITGVPGFDAQQEADRQREDDNATPESSIIGGYMGAADGGMPGYPGMGGGPGAPGMASMPGGGGMIGYPGGGGMSGMSGGLMPAAGGSGMSPMMGAGGGSMPGYPGMDGMSGGMGGMMGGGGGSLDALQIEQARKKPKGFTVSVTCAIKTPAQRPSYMSSDSQAGQSGGGGGMGGMMGGGYPGMGGGMGGGMIGYPGGAPMAAGAGAR